MTRSNRLLLNGEDITSVDYPLSLNIVPPCAFFNISTLESVNLHNGITSLGARCFSNTGLLSCTIPQGITTLPEYIFYGCAEITNITLPSSITTINDRAFTFCEKLETLTILSSTAPTLSTVSPHIFTNTGAQATTRKLRVPIGATGYDQGDWLTLLTRTVKPYTLEYIIIN